MSQPEKLRNCFSESYDKIGDAKILANAQTDISSVNEAYFQEENISFVRKYSDSYITIIDLSNAGKSGKTCSGWVLNSLDSDESITCKLFNEGKISTCKQLLDALRSDRPLPGISVRETEIKGVDVFSPFCEAKPLDKIPEKWTKRNFCSAILSGQIYQGVIEERLTDDYALDAARSFESGQRLSIPASARSFVENWSSLASLRTGKALKPGVCEISYYDGYSTSKTFLFDVSCDIREGKRRQDEYYAGLAQYNKALESSVISISPEAINSGIIYSVKTLDKDFSTDIYNIREESLQGFVLKERLDPKDSCEQFISVDVMDIDPRGFYRIANFNKRLERYADDPRVIACGNSQQFVTGKALLEFSEEGKYLPVVEKAAGEYADFESFRATLEAFANGKVTFGFSGLSREGYKKSLDRLNQEFTRAGGEASPGRKPSLDQIISGAKQRSSSFEKNDRSKEEHSR